MTDNQTSSPESNADAWQPCCGGEISGMVDSIQRRRRAAIAARMTAAGATLLFCVAAFQFSGFSDEFNFGEICCGDVQKHIAAFRDGTLKDEKTIARIRQHLAECPHCGPAFENLKSQASLPDDARQANPPLPTLAFDH